MESSFDLDINNYNITDLLKFFKLENNFSITDLIKKEEELAIEILSTNNSKFNSKHKFDIINFIKSAKEILLSIKNEVEQIKKKDRQSNLNNGSDPTTGKIINPLGSHPALNTTIIPKDDINGYKFETITKIYCLNSAARSNFFNTTPSFADFNLPPLSDVIEISLASANIPNVMYAYNTDEGTNQIYISEDNTGLKGIVTIPQGNYVPYSTIGVTNSSFVDTLTSCINTQLGSGNRFKVIFNPADYTMTITNSVNTFSIITILKEPNFLCNNYSTKIFNYSNIDDINFELDSKNFDVLTYVQTLGYIMGFRKIYYNGNSSYTTESIFSSSYSNYIYFVLKDYTGSQINSSTIGIEGTNIISEDVLALIPLSSSTFTTTFDNNSNFIYKKRVYFGPVDISKITIKLLNQRGSLINLHNTEFSFSIQVKSIYNLHEKSVFNLRSGGAI